jgi:hypothetical protein
VIDTLEIIGIFALIGALIAVVLFATRASS